MLALDTNEGSNSGADGMIGHKMAQSLYEEHGLEIILNLGLIQKSLVNYTQNVKYLNMIF